MSALRLAVSLVWLAASLSPSHADQEWTYEGNNGPENWSRLGYKDCDHHRQSPIAISSREVVLRHLDPLRLDYFDHAPLRMNLTNTHLGATASMKARPELVVRGGALPGEYQVVGFHFHWGENDTVGSEHILDGRSYPLEMHIVCKNAKYSDMKKATQRPDGLAVLAVWFEVGAGPASGLVRLASALRRIRGGGSSTLVQNPPSLLELMPASTEHFYRYEGSLTTPGCYEVVTWTLFKDTAKITEKQLQLFRSLKGYLKPIGHNYRFVQLRYGRTVYERRALDEGDAAEVGLVAAQGPPGAVSAAGALRPGLAVFWRALAAASRAARLPR
ncbi:carbonic anhydrase 1-like [Pollicipes pollicipes]|uniref:carbonic anhydrase 1-like n=1 Tax=Pollicipes pollicipes TaxID=41117 RepID=UPI001885428E|nr:carbonic anhydrase 1-like [Pollicipes pollicipes]